MIAKRKLKGIELRRTGELLLKQVTSKSGGAHDLPASMSVSQNGWEMVTLPHLAEQPSPRASSAATSSSGSHQTQAKARSQQQLGAIEEEDFERLSTKELRS